MSKATAERLCVKGVNELWLQLSDADSDLSELKYRPAVLIECKLNFRSLRAGLNHSEERSYTAWLPEGDLAIDWDRPAVELSEKNQLGIAPNLGIGYRQGNYLATKESFGEYQAELIDKLVRSERLRVFWSPTFGLFSAPGERREDFLARVADAALRRVEPELKRLRNQFDLLLEQVREAQARKGTGAESVRSDQPYVPLNLISRNLHLFESENRLAMVFSTLAGTVFGEAGPSHQLEEDSASDIELRQDLDRIEQEAIRALRALYSEYLVLANEYDIFEIGLQPGNIQVVRNALLWVPVKD
jgi:hypothetical protein